MHPARIVEREYGKEVAPPVTEQWIAEAFGPTNSGPALATSDRLIAELEAADRIVIGLPVYNFGVPAAFKAWIDQVVRVGRTFAKGTFRGLLRGKKVKVFLASGQPLDGTTDFVTPWLKQVFRFVGIEDVEVVNVTARPQAAAA